MARLPAATREQFPEKLKYVWDAAGARDGAPNIFRAMGNNPQVMRGYMRLGNALWNHCGLDMATRELAILRVALLHRSAYEWHQHVRIARGAGLSEAKVKAVADWEGSPAFGEAERAMLGYIDALHRDGVPPREAHDRLAGHFDARTVTGICLLAAYYAMTATFLSAMDVETEGPFVGWQL